MKTTTTSVSRVIEFLRQAYGVKVTISDFPEEEGVEIGALRHKEILVNEKSRGETAILFVIAHLFGHMVQFSDYDRYRYLVEETEKPKPLILSAKFKKRFYAYELEAYEYGKRLLQIVLGKGKTEELDEKFQIYFQTDFSTFWDFLTSGHQITIDAFNALLERNYVAMAGNFPHKLSAKELPADVDPKKDVVVY